MVWISAFLSFLVVVFFLDARRWRARTESTNRRRKNVENGARAAREGFDLAYTVRGDVLKTVSQKHARAIEKISNLARELSEAHNLLQGANHTILTLTERVRKTESFLAEGRRAFAIEEATCKAQRKELNDLRAYSEKQGIDIQALQQKFSATARARALVSQIVNVPASTEALTGKRFRLAEISKKTGRWILRSTDAKTVAKENRGNRRLSKAAA